MKELLNEALIQIPKIKSGTEFLVRDLFRGYKWSNMSINTRRDLGNVFFKKSQNPYLDNRTIVALEKNASKQQVYKKN